MRRAHSGAILGAAEVALPRVGFVTLTCCLRPLPISILSQPWSVIPSSPVLLPLLLFIPTSCLSLLYLLDLFYNSDLLFIFACLLLNMIDGSHIHLVQRGLDTIAQRYEEHGGKPFEVPTWGVFLLGGTILFFYFASVAVCGALPALQ